MFTASGLLVRFLKVFEKSGYQSVKWVRYLTKANGSYQIRVSRRVDSTDMPVAASLLIKLVLIWCLVRHMYLYAHDPSRARVWTLSVSACTLLLALCHTHVVSTGPC